CHRANAEARQQASLQQLGASLDAKLGEVALRKAEHAETGSERDEIEPRQEGDVVSVLDGCEPLHRQKQKDEPACSVHGTAQSEVLQPLLDPSDRIVLCARHRSMQSNQACADESMRRLMLYRHAEASPCAKTENQEGPEAGVIRHRP